ncbi:Uncharacterised protein [uncultured archaeon]|nr:Uncharacterised protein [uncultured archaeon]
MPLFSGRFRDLFRRKNSSANSPIQQSPAHAQSNGSLGGIRPSPFPVVRNSVPKKSPPTTKLSLIELEHELPEQARLRIKSWGLQFPFRTADGKYLSPLVAGKDFSKFHPKLNGIRSLDVIKVTQTNSEPFMGIALSAGPYYFSVIRKDGKVFEIKTSNLAEVKAIPAHK